MNVDAAMDTRDWISIIGSVWILMSVQTPRKDLVTISVITSKVHSSVLVAVATISGKTESTVQTSMSV